MESVSYPDPSISLLLVEDDDTSRKTLATMLSRKFPEVTVYTAANGRDGLELFKTHTPQIVVTDINMPEMGGAQMADKIRAIVPDTRFIVITADTGMASQQQVDCEGFEVDHYILKPVSIAHLFA